MDDCYTISISKHETKQIKYSDIIAFRCIKSSHYIAIDTITDLYRQRATINTLCGALPDYFLQTNRSTIMNINHIQSISQKDITGSNDLIYPLSIEYADDVKKRWIRSSNPYINCSVSRTKLSINCTMGFVCILVLRRSLEYRKIPFWFRCIVKQRIVAFSIHDCPHMRSRKTITCVLRNNNTLIAKFRSQKSKSNGQCTAVSGLKTV